MKKLLVLTLLCAASVLQALTLEKECQILIPDGSDNAALDMVIHEAARVMREVLSLQLKTQVPVRKCSEALPGVQSIRLGGADPAKLRRWEYRIEVEGKDLLLYGRDMPGLTPKNTWFEWEQVECGTVKAAAEFLERFAGVTFLIPGEKGYAVTPLESITVPDDFRLARVPAVDVVSGLYRRGPAGALYQLSLNCFPAGKRYKTYGGHSHEAAVPLSLRNEHPEYFALMQGKRTARLKHCLSNPEVQRRIYDELLKQCDLGYEMVQLGQSDGSGECECPECKALYGVDELGEKIWIMHRKMAEQLLKDRPGKIVAILAYGPTRKPPQTFKTFPANTAVELAPCSEKVLAEWKDYTVPQGFGGYLYNWGVYHYEGFTPKRTFKYLHDQVKLLIENRIGFLYRCGGRELPGLEGPAYFIWGKLLADPDLSADELLKKYCRAAFGKGAEDMERFFRLLDSRLEFDAAHRPSDWDNTALLEGRNPSSMDNVSLLKMRYTPEVCCELEALLTRAEMAAGKDNLCLPLVRMEFDYIKRLSDIFAAHDRYLRECSDEHFAALTAAFNKRERFIETLPRWENAEPPRTGFYTPELRLFGGCLLSELRDNGTLRGRWNGFWPFGCDMERWQAQKLNPARRVAVSGGDWQYLIQDDIRPQVPEIERYYRKFRVRHDDENLYVEARFGNLTTDEVMKETFNIYIGRDGERFFFANSRLFTGENTWFGKRVLTSEQNNGDGDKYERKTIRSEYELLPPDDAGAPGVLITIPWSEVGGKHPEFEFNVNSSGKKTPWLGYIWNFNPRQRSWRNRNDLAGTLKLQSAPLSSERSKQEENK